MKAIAIALSRLCNTAFAGVLAPALLAPCVCAAPGQQAYLKASNSEMFDWFGRAVAISGDTLVIGADREDSNASGVNGDQNNNSLTGAGAAYVFVRRGETWEQQAYLKSSNPSVDDWFGLSVAVSGDTIVVGAPSEGFAGAAYVFERTGATWVLRARLVAATTKFGDQFGWPVAISGDTIAVGAFYEDSAAAGVNPDPASFGYAETAGAAYVFVRAEGNWVQQAYLKASNTGEGDAFGRSVAISGDTLVVGAVVESSRTTGVNGDQSDNSAYRSGAAYVFVRDGTNWTQQAYLKASNTEALDWFGMSVAVSGDTVLVGAPDEDSNATGANGSQANNAAPGAGAAYVFTRNGTNWSQQAYLKASNTSRGDTFGRAVALSGDTAVIGAEYEDSDAVGVNGFQGDTFRGTNSGAAYVFTRHGTQWTQQAYLKPSHTTSNLDFGVSVAMSGDTFLIGAPFESSNATGINGDEINGLAPMSGAAYVFTGLGIGPRLALVPDGSGGQFIRFAGAPDVSYRLQRAGSLAGSWDTLATLIGPSSGSLEFHDTAAPPGQAFYRTVQP